MNSHRLPAGYRGLLCLALLAIITGIPVHAAGAGSPAADSNFPIQQAHLAWMAEGSDVQMVASVAYVETLYGEDTSTMHSLYSDFVKAKSGIGSVTSMPALVNHTSLMQKTAVLFDRETKNQINKHQGKMKDLQEQVGRAISATPYIAMKKDAYWATRSAQELDDFDTWVVQTQKTLDALQARGYIVTGTQPYLDRFASLKTELKSSLDSKDFDRADATALKIRDRSAEISNRIAALQEQVSLDRTAEFQIDEADRVVARADRINNQLVEQILDIGPAGPVLSKTKNDVKLAHGAQNGGQKGLAATQLLLLKKDYRDLASAYRDIAVSASLPAGMADLLKATAISLEETAARIGES